MTNQEKLKHCLEQQRSLQLINNHLQKLEGRLEERRKDLAHIEQVLEKELQDIIALEALGMRKLFHKVLGSVAQQLEIERQEYLMIVLKHKEVVKGIELMEFEQNVLQEKLNTLSKIDAEVKRLVDIREQELMSLRGTHRKALSAINQKVDGKIAEKREIYEAKIVAAQLKQKIKLVLKNLKDAVVYDQWGEEELDVKVRRNYVDKAQKAYYSVRQLVEQLEDELYDIYQHRNIRFYELVEHDKIFTNSHNANLITDWVIHKRIKNSILGMEFLFDRIERLSDSLDHEEKKVGERITTLEEEKEQLILKSAE